MGQLEKGLDFAMSGEGASGGQGCLPLALLQVAHGCPVQWSWAPVVTISVGCDAARATSLA